ncbi:phosphotransferase [Sodalis endosymbiont of Henestaris halophilus]
MQLGVNRRREFRLLRVLKGSGLAPRPRSITSEWLIMEWLPGEPINAQGWQQALTMGTIAAILARLHQHRCSGYPLNLQTRYARYWQASDPSRRSPTWLRLHRRFLHRSQPSIMRQALLHMDVHQGNVLHQKGGSLMLIDWEYAGDGDIALELAALFCGNSLPSADRERLLADYLQLMPGLTCNHLCRQIKSWIPWVNYLMLLWYETRWFQTSNQHFIDLAAPLRRYFDLSS